MAKGNTFRRFMTALKRHWKSALPEVTQCSEPPAPLRRGMTFDAGTIHRWNQHLYLSFQTTWREAGHFTINMIIVDDGCAPSVTNVHRRAKPGEKLAHGGH